MYLLKEVLKLKMVFKKLFGKFKKEEVVEKKVTKRKPVKKKVAKKKTVKRKTIKTTKKKVKKSINSKYPNRFVKFYHLNKKRLNNERRSSYITKKKKGICVRCNDKSVKGIVFCKYHRQKQKGYNKIARSK